MLCIVSLLCWRAFLFFLLLSYFYPHEPVCIALQGSRRTHAFLLLMERLDSEPDIKQAVGAYCEADTLHQGEVPFKSLAPIESQPLRSFGQPQRP